MLRALARGDAKTARQHALALVRPILERPEVRDALAVVRWEPTWQEAAVRLAEAAIVGEHVEKRSGSEGA